MRSRITPREALIRSASNQSPLATYQRRRSDFDARRLAAHRRWNLVANLRLLGFVAFGLAAWWSLTASTPLPWGLVVIFALTTAALVSHHTTLRRRRDRLAGLVTANDLAIARLELDWPLMPEPPVTDVPRSHPYAWDLDIVGLASLERLVAEARTQPR